MIDQFTREHFDYNGITPKRREFVLASVRNLETFVGRSPETTTHEEFEAFLRHELGRGLAPTSVAQTGKALKPFFRWAWRRGTIDADRYMRLRDVSMPRLPADANLPRPYTRKDLDRFWEAFDERWPLLTRPSTYARWLDGRAKWLRVWRHAMHLQIECIVHLALHCGLRHNEIFTATIDNIHYDNEWVVVPNGKGGRYREVPHTEGSRKAVYDWLEVRTAIAPSHDRAWLVLNPIATPNSAIAPSHPFNAANAACFGRMIKTIPGSGQGDDYWQLHRFRHTCATEWLRAGMDLEIVSRYLGHSGIKMTLVYTQIVRNDIHAAAQRSGEQFERAVGRRKENNAHT